MPWNHKHSFYPNWKPWLSLIPDCLGHGLTIGYGLIWHLHLDIGITVGTWIDFIRFQNYPSGTLKFSTVMSISDTQSLLVLLTQVPADSEVLSWDESLKLVKEPVRRLMRLYLYVFIQSQLAQGVKRKLWDSHVLWEDISETVVQVSPVFYTMLFRKFSRVQRQLKYRCAYCNQYGHLMNTCPRKRFDSANKKTVQTETHFVKCNILQSLERKIDKMTSLFENSGLHVTFSWELCDRVEGNPSSDNIKMHDSHCTFCNPVI